MADAEPDADAQAKADLADIPKIPYARGLKLSSREIMRIAMLLGTLVLLLVMQQPCAQAVSSFVSGFDMGSGSAAQQRSVAPRPVVVPPNAVHIKAGMTDEQVKATIDGTRGSDTGSGTGTGSGSAN